ncbi:hypothetical protein G1C96_0239 [Bifidobacterium sp. DSM 109958]|uniref:Uncharacterized protein n=1 Tax=Bifidobacterium moraviense TaxID=2675323 RepID=A0A7Y0HXQ2_9BIFI|nr:hypothetical protein [Bifidobacterium sp. DSM 109958]NMM99661.1 hypothetical protein [Bifidobacterium sp. DSM 109958]
MGNDGVRVFDVEPTKVTEFSLLFEGDVDFVGKNRLLLDGNKTYECGRLRHVTEHPTAPMAGAHGTLVESDVMDEANEKVMAQTGRIQFRTA